MTLRPVRCVAVCVLTCTLVLTGCTSGSGSAPKAPGTSTRAMGEQDDNASTWVWT